MAETVRVTATPEETGATPPSAGTPKGTEVPDEFKNEDGSVNTEALYEAYRKLSPQEGEPEEPADEGTEGEGAEDTEETSEEVGVFTDENMARWSEEFTKTGKLSDETIKEIGVPRKVVEAFIQANQASAEANTAKFLEKIGGQAEFDKIAAWSQTNMEQAERDKVNKILAGSDEEAKLLVLQGLQARMNKNAPPRRRVGGGGGGGGPSNAFKSFTEMKEAMRDPRYKTSEAFRREVAERARGLSG